MRRTVSHDALLNALKSRTLTLAAHKRQTSSQSVELDAFRAGLADRTSELIEVRKILVDRTAELELSRAQLIGRTDELVETRTLLRERTDALEEMHTLLLNRTATLEALLAQSRAACAAQEHLQSSLAQSQDVAARRDQRLRELSAEGDAVKGVLQSALASSEVEHEELARTRALLIERTGRLEATLAAHDIASRAPLRWAASLILGRLRARMGPGKS